MEDYIEKYYTKYYGQYHTKELKQCIDIHGSPIPWMTYSAIFQIEQYSFEGMTAFEWGTGYSSLFWAKRCAHLTTIDHNKEWTDFVKNKNSKNIQAYTVDISDYATSITSFSQPFDLIIIDGDTKNKMRYSCAIHAMAKLATGGLIILDNSDWQPNACQLLRSNGFSQSDYMGLGPINPYAWCTSFFHKAPVKFPRKPISPGFVPGGLESVRD